MSNSIESTVGMGLALKSASLHQDIQMSVLKKVLDHKASSVATLIDSATVVPKPHGMKGSIINTYA